MKKMFLSIKTGHLFCLGLLVIFATLIPTLLLGVESTVYYHDQLDGELIAYIYHAKYLFSGSDIIPEFLNGASKSALTPPAPLAVLLFAVFSPFTAYSILQFGGQLVAYAGMFFLTNRITNRKYISLLVALLYALLPFLPVYGLAQYGIPLLLLCFWNLYSKKHLISSYIYIGIYAAMSSLVLIGFAWIVLGVFLTVYFAFTKKFHENLQLIASFILLLFIYALENIPLIGQILGIGASFISHKEDYVLQAQSFFSQLLTYFSGNTSHSTDHHIWIIPIALGALVFSLLRHKQISDTERKLTKGLLALVGLICVIYAIAALWSIPAIVFIREHFGALKTFQFNRILWIAPALWYISLAIAVSLLFSGKGWLKWIQTVFSIALLFMVCLNCFKTSFVKPNVQELLTQDYDTISYSDYFALGVMDQVEEFLHEAEGLTMNQYKVASLGIDPSAALYHGFYCVDGYSNNYPLSYKKEFRKVVAKEIDKSLWLQAYFDDWGNRCYLLSSELYGYYTIEKNSFWYTSLELDTKALKDLGCDYILSAAYIIPAADMNLTLLGEFETPNSYYKIFVYKIDI